MRVGVFSFAMVGIFGIAAVARLVNCGAPQPRVSLDSAERVAPEDPHWGCGLLGDLPGISQDGTAAPETQKLINGLKGTSSSGKISYWNWNWAPQTDDGAEQHLTKDFVFMPESWGVGAAEDKYVRQANAAGFLDSNGKVCPATMADILLGANEPDIKGSCMGNMFGTCLKSCSQAAIARGDCPEAHLHGPPAQANRDHECNCWQDSHATGVGFWPVKGCAGDQPLPALWNDTGCADVLMDAWRQTAKTAVAKGYKYLSTPLVARNVGYARRWIEKACRDCTDISCGCPVYVGFHFYGYDCRPSALGGYATFEQRLKDVAAIMDDYPFVKGAIINEVGMLNCAGMNENPICVPDSGKYPASKSPDHACPKNDELPQGLSTFVEELFNRIIDAKTSKGHPVVKGFSWFNLNQAGGTYNLRLFDDSGNLNMLGETYVENCQRWTKARRAVLVE